MQNFNDFLNEASLRKNKGIPGQRGNSNDSDYLKDVDGRQKVKNDAADLPIDGDQFASSDDAKALHDNMMKMMSIVKDIQGNQKGNEEQLAKLAEEVLRRQYEGIVDDNIIFDIKIVGEGQVEFNTDDEEIADEYEEYDELEDEIKDEVDRAKITNNIIQGEGKNSKFILHTDISTEGLKDIYGEDKYNDMITKYDELSKIADLRDWADNTHSQKKAWQENPAGFAGKVEVSWVEVDEDGNEIEDKEIDFDDLFDMEEEEQEEITNSKNYKPKITIRAVDYVMCLHEGVKGIFELMAANSISDDENIAETVKANAGTLYNEFEDLRYGPYIAADLRDFINENPDAMKYPNLREMVCGYMFMPQNIPTEEFLNLMAGILMKTKEARKKVDEIIAELIAMHDKHELDQHLGSNDDDDHHEDDDTDAPYQDEHADDDHHDDQHIEVPQKDATIDYSRMTPSELQDELDAALDAEDYKLASEISKYMPVTERKIIKFKK